jgi:carbon starvation protein CstA
MKKVDLEIIEILKDVFQLKRVRPIESDHNLRLWMIRMFFVVSVIGIIGRVVLGLSEHEISAEYSKIVNAPIAIFFALLFLHINNEVEETSLILFILSWVALMLGLYV